MKLGTNVHHVNRNCWKGFQGQGSKVKGQDHREVKCTVRQKDIPMSVRPSVCSSLNTFHVTRYLRT